MLASLFLSAKGKEIFGFLKSTIQERSRGVALKAMQAFQEAYSVIEVGENQFVMIGWTDPPGQPSLIGKATYDFYVVEISVAQNSHGLSSFQFIAYTVIFFLFLAVLFVLLKFRKKLLAAKAR